MPYAKSLLNSGPCNIFDKRRCDECFTNYGKTWRSKIPANYRVGSVDSLLDKCDLPNRFVILVLYKVKPVPRAGRIVFSHLALIIVCLQDDTISEPAVKLIRQLEREASHSGTETSPISFSLKHNACLRARGESKISGL